MEEQWKTIEGYEGLYEVSNTGLVKSVRRKVWTRNNVSHYQRTCVERILKPCTNMFGYDTVVLCKNNKHAKFSVHRLVAKAFVPGYFDGAQVNHKDENKRNNVSDNLEWVTPQENTIYGTGIERRAEKIRNRIPIRCTRLDGSFVGEYADAREAGERLGLSSYNILRVAWGRRRHHFGYVFSFVQKPTAEGEQDVSGDEPDNGSGGENGENGGTTPPENGGENEE